MYTFDEIWGNQLIKNNLQNAIRHRKVSHAYLFVGEPGLGKTLFLKTFAKTLECEKGGVTPCQTCISCKTFDSQNHPDIVYVLPEKTKSLGVDDIRKQVTQNIEIKPFQYPYKIFIIENAHSMTIAAQNAMLKTMEEPAGYGVFLLSCENTQNFLPTILSRVITVALKPLSESLVKDYLIKENQLTPREAARFASYAVGNIGRALTLIQDEAFAALRELMQRTVLNIKSFDLAAIFRVSKEWDSFKEHIQDGLNLMYLWYRDLIVWKTTQNQEHLMDKEQVPLYKQEAAYYSLKNLYKKINAISQARADFLSNANFAMTMDVLLLKLKEK